jgi:hypothetical protein
MGLDCWVAYPDSSIGYGSGTSFASPINAGMMACLCQARPNLTQEELRIVIEESASQYLHPDSLLGYGIPDYLQALTISNVIIQGKTDFQAYPNPFKDAITISCSQKMTGNIEIDMISISGDIVLKTNNILMPGGGNIITINGLSTLSPGMYILKISSGSNTEFLHMVKIEK